MASTPAAAARRNDTNHGSRKATEYLVMGRVRLKANTPSAPSAMPDVTRSGAVTLSLALMNEDNAEQGVIRLLRAAAHGVGPGGRLPSVRQIMAELRVSPVTVQHAMRRLTAEGVIEVRASKGAYATARRPTAEVPDLEWQSVALGAKPPGDDSLRDLMAVPAPELVPM